MAGLTKEWRAERVATLEAEIAECDRLANVLRGADSGFPWIIEPLQDFLTEHGHECEDKLLMLGEFK